nr:E3 ubiquitin protein ligase synoviolin B [Hymenolepis microstoma]
MKADLNEAQNSDELSILRQRRLEKLSSAMKEGSNP